MMVSQSFSLKNSTAFLQALSFSSSFGFVRFCSIKLMSFPSPREKTAQSEAKSFIKLAVYGEVTERCVARRPILLFLVTFAASFIAGTVPINGIGKFFRSSIRAVTLIVLQATTITLGLKRSITTLQSASAQSVTCCCVFSPYGKFFASAT